MSATLLRQAELEVERLENELDIIDLDIREAHDDLYGLRDNKAELEEELHAARTARAHARSAVEARRN